MLPVIGTDPIRFSLLKSRMQRRAGNPRESTADCLSQSEQHQQQNQQNPPSITLYPITVEFDRLLRRQQQLRQHQQCCWSPVPLLPTSSASTSTSVPSTSNRASKLASSGRAASLNSSTPAGRSNGHHSSSTSSSKSCTTDPASLLGNLDAHELLYATISHYYASLCQQQQQKSEIALGSARDKNGRINSATATANDVAEQQSLEQLHRTLCTPGTRTMLLLADKSEIVANLKRREISEVKPERQTRANQREGEVEEEEEEEEEEEDETKNDQQLLMTSSQYEADVEADENSDLESEHSLRGHRLHHHHHHHKPSSRRSLLAGASHRLTTTTATANSSSTSNQQDRHQDFCCPSSGINSSMSEDCLTASLRGDEQQQQGPPPPPAPSPAPMVGEHCSRKLPASSASSAAADNCYQQKSRGYRICRLMSCGGGGESSALASSTKTRSNLPLGGIKMGLRGHRSAVMDNNKNRSSIPKEEGEEEDEDESLIASRKATKSSKSSKTVRHFLSGFDHYLEEALQRQQTFWRRMKQQQQQNKITEGERKEEKGGEERLLSVLGIEQQIVGSVTFYKSYRLTGIKVIELALISVRRQYQGAGIGSHLLRAVKQSGQIGPYDAIRVKVPSSNSVLFDFFLANDFSDDLILNASFDQLDSICSDEGDSDEDGDDLRENPFSLFSSEVLGRRGGGGPTKGSLVLNGIDRRASPSPSPMSHLGHSLSFDGFGNGSPMTTTSADHHRSSLRTFGVGGGGGGDSRISKSKSTILFSQSGGTPGTSSTYTPLPSKSYPNKQKKWWTSLCYLPPFSVATSLCSRDYHHGTTTSLNSHHPHHQRPPSSSSLVGQLDNRYVDELIEEANGVWRRDLLAAYRTQWSCVGRLRAEIARLRTVIVDAEQSIETLQRENLQLRARLRRCKSETTAQLNAQKHLFLLKNFNFDSLDF